MAGENRFLRKNRGPSKNRDYKDEYEKFGSSEKAKKERAARNKNRREAEADGKVRKGDGKDIAHKDSNPRNNSKANLKIQDSSKNRGRANEGGRVKKPNKNKGRGR